MLGCLDLATQHRHFQRSRLAVSSPFGQSPEQRLSSNCIILTLLILCQPIFSHSTLSPINLRLKYPYAKRNSTRQQTHWLLHL